MFNIRKQLSRLYLSSIISNLTITGAWLAILAARGFSLVEIGISETIFHVVSIFFEIPSGVMADVFGRKKMLMVSTTMYTIATLIMIMSNSFFTVCLSIAFHALTYNFSSGTGDALAYDSMKKGRIAHKFEKYESNQLIIYRVCSGISTLCAGFALTIGYRLAYATDLISCAAQFIVLSTLTEVNLKEIPDTKGTFTKIADCFRESLRFLKSARKAMGLMLCNSFVGAVDILLLFFLQAKLPEKGLANRWLGPVLLFMELGGVAGSKLILKLQKLSYKIVFACTTALVIGGIGLEHAESCLIMALGGFIAALGDDALQVRTNAKLQKMFPSEQRATLTSVESLSFSLIMIVLSPLAGYLFTCW